MKEFRNALNRGNANGRCIHSKTKVEMVTLIFNACDEVWLWVNNILRPSDAYIRRSTLATLVQIKAFRLGSTKLLSEPILVCCQLDLRNKSHEILIEIQTVPFKKMHLEESSGKWRPVCLSLNVLNIDLDRYYLHTQFSNEYQRVNTY